MSRPSQGEGPRELHPGIGKGEGARELQPGHWCGVATRHTASDREQDNKKARQRQITQGAANEQYPVAKRPRCPERPACGSPGSDPPRPGCAEQHESNTWSALGASNAREAMGMRSIRGGRRAVSNRDGKAQGNTSITTKGGTNGSGPDETDTAANRWKIRPDDDVRADGVAPALGRAGHRQRVHDVCRRVQNSHSRKIGKIREGEESNS